jgi:hypothetical protein
MVPQAHLMVLAMARAGKSPEETAQVTGVPAAAVVVILRSPLGKAELTRGA